METRIEYTFSPKWKRNRYLWGRLAQPGDILIITGEAVNPLGVVAAAWQAARVHGWKIKTTTQWPHTVRVMRVE